MLATSCASGRLDATKPVGENAKDIDFLMRLSGYMAVAVGVVVTSLVVYVVWKFRSKAGTEDDLPEQVHGNTKVEIGATAVAAGMLVVLAGFTVPAVLELNDEGDGFSGADNFRNTRVDLAGGEQLRIVVTEPGPRRVAIDGRGIARWPHSCERRHIEEGLHGRVIGFARVDKVRARGGAP